MKPGQCLQALFRELFRLRFGVAVVDLVASWSDVATQLLDFIKTWLNDGRTLNIEVILARVRKLTLRHTHVPGNGMTQVPAISNVGLKFQY